MGEDRSSEPDSLRRSLEILEERMESLKIPEEPSTESLTEIQPRKRLERTISQHSHPEQEPMRSPSGQITPPVIFPRKPGTNVADIEITPVPTKVVDIDEEQTPKPYGNPSGLPATLPQR